MKVVKIVRLTTGEELLCKMEGDNLTVESPVIMLPTNDGKLTFMPYMPYADIEEITFKERNVMFVVKPSDDLEAQYRSMIGDVVIPPKPKLIV